MRAPRPTSPAPAAPPRRPCPASRGPPPRKRCAAFQLPQSRCPKEGLHTSHQALPLPASCSAHSAQPLPCMKAYFGHGRPAVRQKAPGTWLPTLALWCTRADGSLHAAVCHHDALRAAAGRGSRAGSAGDRAAAARIPRSTCPRPRRPRDVTPALGSPCALLPTAPPARPRRRPLRPAAVGAPVLAPAGRRAAAVDAVGDAGKRCPDATHAVLAVLCCACLPGPASQ